MTKFNPDNKEILTYGECLDPAMNITDQKDADQYLSAYIEFQKSHMTEASGKHTPEEICKINLGYWAGYYGNDVRGRVERLFMCSHPVFGSITENGIPSNKEAYTCGFNNKPLNEIRN